MYPWYNSVTFPEIRDVALAMGGVPRPRLFEKLDIR